MRLDHPGLTNEQVIEQVLLTRENDKRVTVIDNDTGRKLLHKSPIAEALERATVEAARREMRQAS